MIGRDLDAADMTAWQALAEYLAERQRQAIQDAVARTLSRGLVDSTAPLVGAGVGRFLTATIAARIGRPYVDMADLIGGHDGTSDWAAHCAPAVAVAMLTRNL